jgi:TPP-dependent pyruvate/acetoin dehydrogenase alpha subunit
VPADVWSLYESMLRSRLYEEAVAQLWHDGLISGEMHLGLGEEAIIAGVVAHLEDGDSMALDHRGTAALLMRGVDPLSLLREMLGRPDGLCGGRGGHMHLFSKEHQAASSGIVGASGPAAAGFALAAQHRLDPAVSVAFFGEGAMNQGMLMESLNLASSWNLPVIFVCKDDGWSIATPSGKQTGGDLCDRARGLGVPAVEVDGRDVAEVWEAARQVIGSARAAGGPTFFHARCVHIEAHFLGYQLLRMVRRPVREMPGVALPLTRSFLRRAGASLRERMAGLTAVLGATRSTMRDPREDPKNDPVMNARASLAAEEERLRALEDRVETDIKDIFGAALADTPL